MINHISKKLEDNLFITLLISLIIFSPLPYGSVNILSFTIIESVIFLLVLIWLLNMTYNKNLIFIKTNLVFPLVIFIFLIILQLIYLPESLLKILSPRTISLYRDFLPLELRSRNFFTLSIYPKETIIELFKLLSYFFVFFLILNKISSKRQFDLIINTIIFFGFFISLFGIIQKYTWSGRVYWFDPPGSAPTPFGPFVNRNHFAGFMEMVIPLTLGYCLLDMQLSKRIFYGFLATIMCLSLFLSLSRAGIFVFTGTLLFMFLVSRAKKGLGKESLILFLLLLFVLSLFLILVGPKPIIERLSTIFARGEFNPLGRGYLLSDGLRIFRHFPILGTGLGTFGSISPMYKTTPDQVFYRYAHNDYLQLIIETGLVGFLFISLFFFLYFSSVLKMWFRRNEPYVKVLVLGGMGAVFGILLHSFVDFNLHIPSNALLFFIILGLTYKLVFTPHQEYTSLRESQYLNIWKRELNSKTSFIISISAILIFLFFLYTSFNRVSSEWIFNRAMKISQKARETKAELVAEKALLYQRSLKLLERAIKLDSKDSRFHFEYANVLTDLTQDEDLALISGFKDKKELYLRAKSKYEDAIKLEPTKAIYHLKLGWIDTIFLKKEQAEKEFQKAKSLDPTNIRNHIYLCRYFLTQNKEESAFYHLNKVVSMYRVIPRGPISEEIEDFLRDVNREDLIKR